MIWCGSQRLGSAFTYFLTKTLRLLYGFLTTLPLECFLTSEPAIEFESGKSPAEDELCAM